MRFGIAKPALLGVLLVSTPTPSAMAAQTFPSKPMRMIVPFPPGGLSDGLARLLALGVVQDWGQPMLIDNRPGAGTTLAADLVAKAPNDGYTLFFQDITTHGINAGLYRKLPYDSVKDFAPVAVASASPLILGVASSLAAKSVKELVALAKSQPGKVNFGSSGNGTILHLSGQLFNKLAGVDLVHVPYKGSPPAVAALLGGEVSIVFATTGSVLPHLSSGKVRALGVTTARRSPLLPDLAPIADTLPGYDIKLYQGILVPAGTPREVVMQLNQGFNRIMSRPEASEQWARLGAEIVIASPEEAGRLFRGEVASLSKLAVESGARIE
ncbi:MAG: tripartite tricarboxylate transporter substrate binding protein [Proteobacteria bacterium]|nr:tripartite tricarboxylate transporter substrate binding protein [Burkholderiales bacterium]